MDEEKKGKGAGISIGIIILVIVLGFGLVIGLTQTKGAQDLNSGIITTTSDDPMDNFYMDDTGKLIAYYGEDKEVVIPATYSLSSYEVTKSKTFTNISDIYNFMQRTGIKNISITDNSGYYEYPWGEEFYYETYLVTYKYRPLIEGDTYTTTSIGQNVFANNRTIKRVTIPDTVTSIGSYAFQNSTIQEIVIPDSVQTLEYGVFAECNSLISIKFSNNIRYIQSNTCQNCYNLQSVILPENLERLGTNSFAWCHSLYSVALPEGLQRIESQAFYNCVQLQSISIPSTVSYIGSLAFGEDYNLSQVVVKAETPPTISSNIFNYMNFMIYVPEGRLATYQSARYWSNYAGYMIEMEM